MLLHAGDVNKFCLFRWKVIRMASGCVYDDSFKGATIAMTFTLMRVCVADGRAVGGSASFPWLLLCEFRQTIKCDAVDAYFLLIQSMHQQHRSMSAIHFTSHLAHPLANATAADGTTTTYTTGCIANKYWNNINHLLTFILLGIRTYTITIASDKFEMENVVFASVNFVNRILFTIDLILVVFTNKYLVCFKYYIWFILAKIIFLLTKLLFAMILSSSVYFLKALKMLYLYWTIISVSNRTQLYLKI